MKVYDEKSGNLADLNPTHNVIICGLTQKHPYFGPGYFGPGYIDIGIQILQYKFLLSSYVFTNNELSNGTTKKLPIVKENQNTNINLYIEAYKKLMQTIEKFSSLVSKDIGDFSEAVAEMQNTDNALAKMIIK